VLFTLQKHGIPDFFSCPTRNSRKAGCEDPCGGQFEVYVKFWVPFRRMPNSSNR